MKIRDLFLYAVPIAIGSLSFACSEDKGNYDYTSLNEVSIDSILASYVREAGAELYIDPGVSSVDEGAANLSFSWSIAGEEVSQEEILDIALPPLSYDTHLCALTVTDNASGMQYRQTFELRVVNPFNYGYYFLTERDDHSTELAYIQAVSDEDGGPTMEDVKYVEGIGDYAFGNNPIQINGTYGYNSTYTSTQWNMTFITEEGDNQVIVTENLSFLPTTLISGASFIEEGYVFKPEALTADMQNNLYFVSNGQFVKYVSGKLYRPARHDKEYYWSHPAYGYGGSAANFAWVYDELSHKCYAITPYATDDIEAGIVADPYAYDQVLEPENNPEIEGTVIYAADAYAGTHTGNFYVAAADGIHIYSFGKGWQQNNPAYIGETVLPLSGMGDAPAFALGTTGLARNQFFVNSGYDIYYSPTTSPKLEHWVSLPDNLGLGEIEYIGLSALANRMVVVLYDESSAEERKGSVVFIDFNTREITHTFPHILHHCVSYLGANESTSLMGYGAFGDEK